MVFLNLALSIIILCSFYYSEEFLLNSMSLIVFFIFFYVCFILVPTIFAEAALKLKFYFILLSKMLKKAHKSFVKYYFSVMSFVIIPISTSLVTYVRFFTQNFLNRLLTLYSGSIFRYIISSLFFYVQLYATTVDTILNSICIRICNDFENFYLLPNTSLISKNSNISTISFVDNDDFDLSEDLFIDLTHFIDSRLINNSLAFRSTSLTESDYNLFVNNKLMTDRSKLKTFIIFTSDMNFSKRLEARPQVLSHFFYFSYFASETFLASDLFQKFNN